jgi:hypothetical protein
MNLDVHLIERLLHMLNMLAGGLEQAAAMAQHSTKGTDLLGGAEGTLEQSDSV